MSVGDVNSNAKGSGARFNEGKPDFSMIPLCTMEDEIRVWMYGAKKYAKNNWMKGMDWDVPFACMMRHMAAWQRGEENDPETGLPHIAHAMCNLRMLTLYSKTFKEGDHRPSEWLQEYMPQRPIQTDIHASIRNDNLPVTTMDGKPFRSIVESALQMSGPAAVTNLTHDTHGWTANATNKTK